MRNTLVGVMYTLLILNHIRLRLFFLKIFIINRKYQNWLSEDQFAT